MREEVDWEEEVKGEGDSGEGALYLGMNDFEMS